ncbi:hypothetical protein BaRGS_00008189, partial [Batillaria attramentaria]
MRQQVSAEICVILAESHHPVCSLKQMMTCSAIVFTNILDEALASDLFGCPRPCHAVSYVPIVSSSYFPSPRAEQSLQWKGIIRNVSDIRLNYLELNFYYEDLVIYTTKHVPEYETNSIMGTLGGNMGFFLGASVLTLAEILDFVVCLVMALGRRLCGFQKLGRGRSVGNGNEAVKTSIEAW